MRKKNCRIETRSALVISAVFEEVHPEMILSCISCEIVSLLICGDHRRDRVPRSPKKEVNPETQYVREGNTRVSEGQRRFLISNCGMGLLLVQRYKSPHRRKQLMCLGSSIGNRKIILYIPVVQEWGLRERVAEVPSRTIPLLAGRSTDRNRSP